MATRTDHRRGPAWIGAELAVPARTVSRVLVRGGQPRLCELDPLTGEVIRSSKQTATRDERSRPGELAHMDVKKIGRIPTVVAGVRTVGPPAAAAATGPPGSALLCALAVDDHSRLAYSEVLPDEKGATCAAFLARGPRPTSPRTASTGSSG